LNMDLKHGWLNYLIGTNEVHRWHHSTRYNEAKNFAIIMIWDHLFGTFYFPRDRDMPEKTGLGDETNYPLHSYWQQLLLPFRWHSLKGKPPTTARTGTVSTTEQPAIEPAGQKNGSRGSRFFIQSCSSLPITAVVQNRCPRHVPSATSLPRW